MRVFSSASVLLTFMSQASFSSGSHILTIGTLAEGTQTTRSMPSVTMSEPVENGIEGWVDPRLASASANMCTVSSFFIGVWMQMSTNDPGQRHRD